MSNKANYCFISLKEGSDMVLRTINPNRCIHHKTNQIKVGKYKSAMEKGIIFPAVEVLFHNNSYYVRDGAHRVSAAKEAGIEVLAEVFTIDDYPNLWLLGKRLSWKLK
jgi:hypothetical protein